MSEYTTWDPQNRKGPAPHIRLAFIYQVGVVRGTRTLRLAGQIDVAISQVAFKTNFSVHAVGPYRVAGKRRVLEPGSWAPIPAMSLIRWDTLAELL